MSLPLKSICKISKNMSGAEGFYPHCVENPLKFLKNSRLKCWYVCEIMLGTQWFNWIALRFLWSKQPFSLKIPGD